ncbi:MAG: hypothetical protein IJ320_06560 [Phascolarctobacterium sp.]|nr:hypothetical protein [Phascolarctobacterium sp.]
MLEKIMRNKKAELSSFESSAFGCGYIKNPPALTVKSVCDRRGEIGASERDYFIKKYRIYAELHISG